MIKYDQLFISVYKTVIFLLNSTARVLRGVSLRTASKSPVSLTHHRTEYADVDAMLLVNSRANSAPAHKDETHPATTAEPVRR